MVPDYIPVRDRISIASSALNDYSTVLPYDSSHTLQKSITKFVNEWNKANPAPNLNFQGPWGTDELYETDDSFNLRFGRGHTGRGAGLYGDELFEDPQVPGLTTTEHFKWEDAYVAWQGTYQTLQYQGREVPARITTLLQEFKTNTDKVQVGNQIQELTLNELNTLNSVASPMVQAIYQQIDTTKAEGEANREMMIKFLKEGEKDNFLLYNALADEYGWKKINVEQQKPLPTNPIFNFPEHGGRGQWVGNRFVPFSSGEQGIFDARTEQHGFYTQGHPDWRQQDLDDDATRALHTLFEEMRDGIVQIADNTGAGSGVRDY